MLSEGNSSTPVCARNLIAAMQREIPFARTKGMNPDVFDMPFDEAEGYLDEAARTVLTDYEDRVDVDAVALDFGEDGDGEDASYTVEIASLGDDEDDDYEDDD